MDDRLVFISINDHQATHFGDEINGMEMELLFHSGI